MTATVIGVIQLVMMGAIFKAIGDIRQLCANCAPTAIFNTWCTAQKHTVINVNVIKHERHVKLKAINFLIQSSPKPRLKK